MNIRFEDNHEQFQRAMADAIERALEAIGITAEGYAKQKCPVDTGRLRNSISHAVESGEQTAYIGTNVSYAPYVEMGTSRMAARPFLKPAALDHTDEYKRIAMQNMQGS